MVSQEGVIKIFQNGAYLSTPFLDISSLVTYNDEQGLLSMDFHPNYVNNGWFYVYYVDNLTTPGSVTIARYTVSSDPNVADPGSAQIVLVIPNPFDDTHRGGRLEFGPDGYLYAGIGDSGGVGDPDNRAQNTSSLFGKLLRLDVNGTGAVPCGQTDPMPYAIPPSNPFVGVAGACEEIWAYGFRNPWRFSFDRADGRHVHRRRRRELCSRRSTSSPPRARAARTTAGGAWRRTTATTLPPTATTGRWCIRSSSTRTPRRAAR